MERAFSATRLVGIPYGHNGSSLAECRYHRLRVSTHHFSTRREKAWPALLRDPSLRKGFLREETLIGTLSVKSLK